MKSVCCRPPERWQGDRFPEFLHSALHHYEPPCAPEPKSSIFLLQRAHGHTIARPDARCSHPGKMGVCLPPQAWWVISATKLMTPSSSRVSTQKGFDVFNALDLMENKTFLEKLKFGIGDGNLQYYLYNWKCPIMGADKVSLLIHVLYNSTIMHVFFLWGTNLNLYSVYFRSAWCCSDVLPRQNVTDKPGEAAPSRRPPERQTDDFLFRDRKNPPPIFTFLTLQTLTCTTAAG